MSDAESEAESVDSTMCSNPQDAERLKAAFDQVKYEEQQYLRLKDLEKEAAQRLKTLRLSRLEKESELRGCEATYESVRTDIRERAGQPTGEAEVQEKRRRAREKQRGASAQQPPKKRGKQAREEGRAHRTRTTREEERGGEEEGADEDDPAGKSRSKRA
jgi:hypothetical protein